MRTLLIILMLACAFTISAQTGLPVGRQDHTQTGAIDHYIETYQFEQASNLINSELAALNRRRRLTPEQTERKAWLEQQRDVVERLQPMLAATRRVVFIDSLVVPKSNFLQHIHLSPESGRISTYAHTFRTNDTLACTVYQPELGADAYLAAPCLPTGRPTADGASHLFKSTLEAGRWTMPEPLSGLPNDSAQNHPFMLPDGVTLYYSAINDDTSIGGYDLFTTRWDADEHHYLQPENLGFPFSSIAGDYMLAIDELNQLGWLVTDRRQPIDSVCIYIFIPETLRRNWLDTGCDPERLPSLARIASIADTQTDIAEVEAARRRLFEVRNAQREVTVVWDFTFVGADDHVYHFINDFPPAHRPMARQWQEKSVELRATEMQLNLLRSEYAHANNNRRGQMRSQLLTLERQHEQLIDEVSHLEQQLRNL